MHELDDVTGAIVDASLRIHRDLGPGLLESAYESVLARSLERRGFQVARQQAIRFEYDGLVFEEGFRADLVVERCVIVELKSVERLAPVHGKQLLTCLRLTGMQVGLLVNFGAATLKEGLRRIVNNLPASTSPALRVNQPRLVGGLDQPRDLPPGSLCRPARRRECLPIRIEPTTARFRIRRKA